MASDKTPSQQLTQLAVDDKDDANDDNNNVPPAKPFQRLPDGSLPDHIRKEIFTDRGISATSGLPPTMKLIDYFADCPPVEPKDANDKPRDPQAKCPPS